MQKIVATTWLLRAALAVAMLATPATASADATLTFDDVAAGATITTQYQAQGVTFGPTAPGQGQATANVPAVTSVGSTAAASGTQIGQVARRCLGLECVGTTEAWWQFSGGPRSRVSVSVGAFGTAQNTITLTAFTSAGAAISSTSSSPSQATVTGGSGFRTRLTVASLTTNIAFVRVRGSTIGPIGLDSITFDTPAPPPPSFTLRPRGTTALDVQQGAAGGIDLVVDRTNFAGTIRITADAATLPSGVTMTPVETTSASQQIVRVTFNAAATAPPRAGAQVRIVAAHTLSKTPAAQSTTITLDVVVLTDARITGIEATQGVQTLGFPAVDTTVATTKTYAGVPLYANGKTVVRVYASNGRSFFPATGTIFGATMRLHGINAATGAALPLSPLLPDAGPGGLVQSTSPVVTSDERVDPARAFTFTLPASWTGTGVRTTVNQPGFNLQLRAELVLQPSQTHIEATTANNAQTLRGITFTPTCCLNVATVLLRHDDHPGDPRPIRTILREALNVTPLEWNVPDYQTEMDVTESLDNPGEGVDARVLVATDMIEFSQRDARNDVVVGFGVDGFPACGGVVPYAICDDTASQPYTRAAHEFFHALGAVIPDASMLSCTTGISCHASRGCDAGLGGTTWPPDEIGLLQGIALDRSGAPPYRIMASLPGVPATVGEADPGGVYDFMSYCAGDKNSWLGPKNWTDALQRFARDASPIGSAGVRRAAAAPAAAGGARRAQAPAPRLVVNAVVSPSGATAIASVFPGAGDRGAGTQPSPYVLAVRDGAGALLAQVPMRQRGDHFHDRPAAFTLTGVAGVDVARAARVEVVRDGTVVAARARSARAPAARLLSPRRGTLAGRGDKLDIRWQASDADGDRLRVVVEWSARGGRPGTWRAVSLGADGGRVALPSEYFAGSDDAFLRLRVNDGFNETVVLSAPFRTVHRAPRVQITSPRAGARVRAGATLYLAATALDERGQTISGGGVRWFDGRRPLGRGAQLAVASLRPGVHRLRAVATDAGGRRSSALMSVRVDAVAPLFEVLAYPRTLPASARRLTLRVAATVPSMLTVTAAGVRPARAAVGRRARAVVLRVRPGTAPLRLRLTLRAAARTSRGAVTIARAR